MIKTILKNILDKKVSFFVIIIINVLALTMISLSIYIYYNSRFCEDTIRKTMHYDVENMGIIWLNSTEYCNELTDEETSLRAEILTEISKSDKMISVGCYDNYNGLEDTEIENEQNSMRNSSEELLEYSSFDSNIIDMFNIKLTEGTFDKKAEMTDKYTIYVYLGQAYKKKYKINDVITKKYSDAITIKMIVKGFFADDQRIILGDTFMDAEAFSSDKCYKELEGTDVLAVQNMKESGSLCYAIWDEKYDYDEIEAEINSIAGKYGKQAHLISLSELIKEKESAGKSISGYIDNVLWIVIITVIIMVSCIQVTGVFNNSKNYGIMYANGFSTKNILTMLFAENIIRCILAIGISLIATFELAIYLFSCVENETEVIKIIFNQYIIKVNILSAIAISLIAIIVPTILICRMKPVQLIGGED